MTQVGDKRLSPKEAVDAAFKHFKDLFGGRHFNHLLLEGVKFDDTKDVWEITFGFDIGREKRASGQLSIFGDEREPIREFRVIRLRAHDGAFLELDHV